MNVSTRRPGAPATFPGAGRTAGHVSHAAQSGLPGAAAAQVALLRRTGATHVWSWRLPDRSDARDLALLDEEEHSRARRFHASRDAAAFTRTRAGARRAIGALLGLPPQTVRLGRRTCPSCGDGAHGPPAIIEPSVPLAISLSRTAGCGVLALGAGDWIGVDIEALRAVDVMSLASIVLTDSERERLRDIPEGPARAAAFHRCWTRKEAVVKAAGLGLLGAELTSLEVRPERSRQVHVNHTYRGSTTVWAVDDLCLDGPWAVALARPAGPGARAPGPVICHPIVPAGSAAG